MSLADTERRWAELWRRIASQTSCPAVRRHAEDVQATVRLRDDMRVIHGAP